MKYANLLGYTDVEPYEVIRAISDKTIEVRAMRAELDPTWKPDFHIGGFCAHCSNQNSQRWNITSDPDGHVLRLRLAKNGHWKHKGLEFHLADAPRKFHDYNF
jgi:hypothetical protein